MGLVSPSRVKQQGVAAVEFTIMLPMLLLMVFVTAELGRALYQYSELTRLVRGASRYLSTTAIPDTSGSLDSNFDDGCSDDSDCVCYGCISDTKDILVYGHVGGTAPLLYGLSKDDVTISGDSTTTMVTISVDYDWQPLFGERISGFGFGEGIDLGFNFNVSYTMRAL